MFSILILLLLTGYLLYQGAQASKQRAADAERRRDEDEKMPKVAVDRAFIARVSRSGGGHVSADMGSISKILRQWDPKPSGAEAPEGEYDDIAGQITEQLRRKVDAGEVAKVLRQQYARKYGREAQSTDGIANYIVNWWRAYILE